jgi:HD domain
MLSIAEADGLVDRHLGTTSRAVHTRFVANIMRQLAGVLSADAELWEIVGLCHDLDYFETRDNPSAHGVLATTWLGERIPAEARAAIASHDHRTGIQADTLLADALKMADVIAVIDARLGRRTLCDLDRNDALAALRARLPDRLYLCDMLERYAKKTDVPVGGVIDMAAASPLPSQ